MLTGATAFEPNTAALEAQVLVIVAAAAALHPMIAALLMEPYVFDRTLEAQYAALDALERIAEVLMAASFTFDNAAESEANA